MGKSGGGGEEKKTAKREKKKERERVKNWAPRPTDLTAPYRTDGRRNGERMRRCSQGGDEVMQWRVSAAVTPGWGGKTETEKERRLNVLRSQSEVDGGQRLHRSVSITHTCPTGRSSLTVFVQNSIEKITDFTRTENRKISIRWNIAIFCFMISYQYSSSSYGLF